MSDKTNGSQNRKQKKGTQILRRYRGNSFPLLYKVILIYGVTLLVLVSLGRYFVAERGQGTQDSLPILDLKVSLAGKMATNRARLQLMRSKLIEAEWRAHNRRYQILLDQIEERIDYYDMSIDNITNINVQESYSPEDMKALRAALNELLRSEMEYEDILSEYQLLVLKLMLNVDRQKNEIHILN